MSWGTNKVRGRRRGTKSSEPSPSRRSGERAGQLCGDGGHEVPMDGLCRVTASDVGPARSCADHPAVRRARRPRQPWRRTGAAARAYVVERPSTRARARARRQRVGRACTCVRVRPRVRPAPGMPAAARVARGSGEEGRRASRASDDAARTAWLLRWCAGRGRARWWGFQSQSVCRRTRSSTCRLSSRASPSASFSAP